MTVAFASASIGSECMPYLNLTPEQKAIIGKYAVEHGIINTICQFQGIYLRISYRKAQFVGGINCCSK